MEEINFYRRTIKCQEKKSALFPHDLIINYKSMKIHNLTKGVIAFSVLSMLASGALAASAAPATSTASTTNITNNRNHGRGFFKNLLGKPANLTDVQKAEMETKKAEMNKKFEAVKAAITASDYTAWVAAEKAINENSPLLTKITADNFSKYVEAYNLRVQADAIMKDLGVAESGMGLGYGPGMNHGMGRGQDKIQE
jgi:Spy/CpxP family protein refolding chaperone